MNDVLSKYLSPAGYHVAYARLPQKLLAVSCGLATYGRNNITYVEGMGSFHRLSTFYSDFPCDQYNPWELKMMDLCEECSACVRKCPTGAIPTDRFLLRAEKCITYHNEQPGDKPFPDWIDPSWHNCLIGCLHCQKICPANKQFKDWVEPGPTFNEDETKLLVSEKNMDLLSDETKKKIEDFDLKDYYELLPRNLGVFFKI
jgi:epoxyqueuosine reductase